jgi:hypothetical protein
MLTTGGEHTLHEHVQKVSSPISNQASGSIPGGGASSAGEVVQSGGMLQWSESGMAAI